MYVWSQIVTLWYRPPCVLLGSRHYTTAVRGLPFLYVLQKLISHLSISQVDVWSCGTIFAEMSSGTPLIPGDSEIDQIFKIFRFDFCSCPYSFSLFISFFLLSHRILGTPTTDIWPGLSQMPDFKPTFPRWRPQPLQDVLPEMDDKALHLLSSMLTYDPARRISGQSSICQAGPILPKSLLTSFIATLQRKQHCDIPTLHIHRNLILD